MPLRSTRKRGNNRRSGFIEFITIQRPFQQIFYGNFPFTISILESVYKSSHQLSSVKVTIRDLFLMNEMSSKTGKTGGWHRKNLTFSVNLSSTKFYFMLVLRLFGLFLAVSHWPPASKVMCHISRCCLLGPLLIRKFYK